jgi:hypothetical protein
MLFTERDIVMETIGNVVRRLQEQYPFLREAFGGSSAVTGTFELQAASIVQEQREAQTLEDHYVVLRKVRKLERQLQDLVSTADVPTNE